MRIQVRAQNPGHEARYRAGRRFPNGQTFEMEVVDGDDPKDANGNPDMSRINQDGFESLKRDPAFSVLAGEAAAGPDGALLDAVRRQASDTAVKLSDAQAENAKLKLENDRLKARIAELSIDGDDKTKVKDDGRHGHKR